jgi:SHS2 domain-containing protein
VDYEFVDDLSRADLAFRAFGENADALFLAAGNALLAAMVVDPDAVVTNCRRDVRVTAPAPDLLLYRFLEEFLFLRDSEGLLLRPVAVTTAHPVDQAWTVTATLAGEPIAAGRHDLRAEVKAVTMHRLAVVHDSGGWTATVVLDV